MSDPPVSAFDRTKGRLATCIDCDKSQWEGYFIKCTECGCFMTVKAAIPWMKCPIGKWGPGNEPAPLPENG